MDFQNNNTTYVPPQLRRKREENVRTNPEKLQQLKKQLKGQLNRLTGKNIHSIAAQVRSIWLIVNKE